MIRRSTRALWKERRTAPNYTLLDFVHGYIYGRWPYAYIGFAKGDRKIPPVLKPLVGLLMWVAMRKAGAGRNGSQQAFADSYHGKVVPTDAAEQLVNLKTPIELRNLEQIIPYATAKDIVLSDPDHLVVLECPCRAGVANPCLPLDVCLIVGEPFAEFILEHHPKRSRAISQNEAVEILRAENERGHVHHAFFKDAMLGRFYAICNCCSCCCGAMQAHRNGTPMLASSGYVAQLASDRCVDCGRCVDACPFGAIHATGNGVAVDVEKCMGCGVCVTACSRDAWSLGRAPEKGEPLDILALVRPAA